MMAQKSGQVDGSQAAGSIAASGGATKAKGAQPHVGVPQVVVPQKVEPGRLLPPWGNWGDPVPWKDVPSSIRKVLRKTPQDQWPQVEVHLAKYPETAELARLARTLEFILDAAPQRFVGLIYGNACPSRDCDTAFRRVRDSIHALRRAMLGVADLAGLKLKGQKPDKPTRRKRSKRSNKKKNGRPGMSQQGKPQGVKPDRPSGALPIIILPDWEQGVPAAAPPSDPIGDYQPLEKIHEVTGTAEGDSRT